MLKRYKIEYLPMFWECTVEVNEEFLILSMTKPDQPYTTMDGMKEMVKFWTGGKDRLKANEGDVTKTFLQQLGNEIMIIASQRDLTTEGIMSEFDEREGWFPMNGLFGIKITFADNVDFDNDSFEVEEITS